MRSIITAPRWTAAALVSLAFAAGPTGGSAQTAVQLHPGDRVRASFAEAPAQVGTVVAATGGEVVIRQANRTLSMPLSGVSSLEVSRGTGRRGSVLRGAGLGFLAGAGVGAALGAVTCASDDEGWIITSPGECAAAGGVVFGAVGGLLGAAVRAVAPATRWERVQLSAGASDNGRGATLGLTLRP